MKPIKPAAHTPIVQPRPRFTRRVPQPIQTCLDTLSAALDDPDELLQGRVAMEYVSVEYPEEQRKFWTPHMELDMAPATNGTGDGDGDGDGGEASTTVYVRIGPSPTVWTGYLALQAVIGFSGLGALMYAWSMNNAGGSPWVALTIFGALVIAGALVFGAAFVGQGLSTNEMYEMRAFLDRVLPGEDEH